MSNNVVICNISRCVVSHPRIWLKETLINSENEFIYLMVSRYSTFQTMQNGCWKVSIRDDKDYKTVLPLLIYTRINHDEGKSPAQS